LTLNGDSASSGSSGAFASNTVELEFTGAWTISLRLPQTPEEETRIAVRFAYEWHDDSGQWFRSYGNENWEFDAEGLMAVRHASINDLVISEAERKYHWPLGQRPVEHAALSELGL
jgi:hypothetical protein